MYFLRLHVTLLLLPLLVTTCCPKYPVCSHRDVFFFIYLPYFNPRLSYTYMFQSHPLRLSCYIPCTLVCFCLSRTFFSVLWFPISSVVFHLCAVCLFHSLILLALWTCYPSPPTSSFNRLQTPTRVIWIKLIFTLLSWSDLCGSILISPCSTRKLCFSRTNPRFESAQYSYLWRSLGQNGPGSNTALFI